MKFFRLALIFGAILSISTKGYSWGDEGHSITALIAEAELAQQSQNGDAQATATLQVLNSILGPHQIAAASIWPDKVKSLARACDGQTYPFAKDPAYGNPPGQSSAVCDAYKYTASWHFANNDSSQYVPHPQDPNAFRGDVVVLINGLSHVLKNETAPSLNGVASYVNWKKQCLSLKNHNCKREALAFLIHFVGDVHQPLHAGRTCDLGGNSQYITFFGQQKDPGAFWCQENSDPSCSNHELHQAWDKNLLTYNPKHQPFNITSYASNIFLHSADTAPKSRCTSVPANSSVNIDGANGPVQWVNESLCYERQVYTFPDDPTANADGMTNFCRADKKIEVGDNHIAFSPFIVDKKYYLSNMPTIIDRLYWGGIRLATLLKNIYGSGDRVSGELN